jgi:erythromycin esterase-like protein
MTKSRFDQFSSGDGQAYGFAAAWNLRDRHMSETLDALAVHLGRQRGEPARIVVWTHNSHVGDARATEAATEGELTIGELVRERHPRDCRLIGFTTYTGTVTAASDWEDPAERKLVRPALPGSLEELFHEVSEKAFWVPFGGAPEPRKPCARHGWSGRSGSSADHRPNGRATTSRPVSRTGSTRSSTSTRRAVEPLERTVEWDRDEAPETYPFTV